MRLLKIILLSSLILTFADSYSQTKNPTKRNLSVADSLRKVAWLRQNAVAIRSIDSTDNDFSDLMPLKRIIGDASVVMIGETSHHIGTMYFAKARLIKFLHQQMGFDLLTFESDIYGVNKAWQLIKEGKDTRDAFKEAVYFGKREEYKPFINYIRSKANSEHPLEIAGFDFALNGIFPYNFLITDLREFFKSINYTPACLEDSSAFAEQIRNSTFTGGFKAPDKWILDTCKMLIKVIDSLVPKPRSFQAEFHLQVLNSVRKFMEYHLVEQLAMSLTGTDRNLMYNLSSEMRDAQMGENLLWYVKQYPKRKIIVWGHMAHLTTKRVSEFFEDFKQDSKRGTFNPFFMGTYIRDALKDKVYNIVIAGNQGVDGNINHVDSTKTFIRKWPHYLVPGELENLLESAGYHYAFVDLRNPDKGGEWLRGYFPMRSDPNETIVAQYSKSIDGIYYIQTFTPTNVKE